MTSVLLNYTIVGIFHLGLIGILALKSAIRVLRLKVFSELSLECVVNTVAILRKNLILKLCTCNSGRQWTMVRECCRCSSEKLTIWTQVGGTCLI